MEMYERKRSGGGIFGQAGPGWYNYGLIPGNGRGCTHDGARNDGCGGRRQLIIQRLSTADNNYRTLSGTCQHVVIGKGHAMSRPAGAPAVSSLTGARYILLDVRTFLPGLLIHSSLFHHNR